MISSRWFKPAGKWLTGDWDGYILVRGRGIWRPARLHTPVVGPAERPEVRQVAPGIRFGVRWVGRQLHVQVTETPAVLQSCAQAGDQLQLEVDVEQPGKVLGGQAPVGARPCPALVQGRRGAAPRGHGGEDRHRRHPAARRSQQR